MIDYALVPAHLRGGLRRYIEEGISTGQFLRAMLEARHEDAQACADETSRLAIESIKAFLYQQFPPEAWGSPERVRAWMSRRQLVIKPIKAFLYQNKPTPKEDGTMTTFGPEIRDAIDRYLNCPDDLAVRDMIMIRVHLRMWVTERDGDEFQDLRERVDSIRNAADISRWLAAAADLGADPLGRG